MRKLLFISVTFAVLLFGAIALHSLYKAPQEIENTIQKHFAELGFKNTTLPAPEKTFGRITYKNIALDEDAFSKINELHIEYDLFSSLFSKRLKALQINGLQLTGELNNDQSVSLAGWNGEITQNLSSLNAKRISIKDISLSLLSEDFGGITVNGDLILKPQGRSKTLQATITATQKQLSAQAKIDAEMTGEGSWHARIDLENGKFKLDDLRATRVAGLINIRGQGRQTTEILGELQTGALSLWGTPWQNGALTVQGTLDAPSLIISAKSAGYEGLELGITIEDLFVPEYFSGSLHVENITNAFDYLGSQSKLSVERENLQSLSHLDNITIDFQHEENLIFSINKQNQDIDFKGVIKKTDEESYSAEWHAPLLPFSTISQDDKTNGTVTLHGKVNKKPDTLNGIIVAQLRDADIPYGDLTIQDVHGKLTIDDVQTLTSQSSVMSCETPFVSIQTTCEITVQIKNGKPDISNLTIIGPGLEIYTPKSRNGAASINIKSIELDPLLKLFNTPQWQGAGRMTGILNIEKEEDKTLIKSLKLSNKGLGVLKLTDDKLFELMTMEDLERETLKLALEDFHFDLLEVEASGEFPNKVKVSVFGKGKNPSLIQGRAFSFDFEIETDISEALSALEKN